MQIHCNFLYILNERHTLIVPPPQKNIQKQPTRLAENSYIFDNRPIFLLYGDHRTEFRNQLRDSTKTNYHLLHRRPVTLRANVAFRSLVKCRETRLNFFLLPFSI